MSLITDKIEAVTPSLSSSERQWMCKCVCVYNRIHIKYACIICKLYVYLYVYVYVYVCACACVYVYCIHVCIRVC